PGWLLGYWLSNPGWLAGLTCWLHPATGVTELADTFLLAGLSALALGGYALTLPPVPPERRLTARLAPVAALRLLRYRSISIYWVCMLAVCATIPFFS